MKAGALSVVAKTPASASSLELRRDSAEAGAAVTPSQQDQPHRGQLVAYNVAARLRRALRESEWRHAQLRTTRLLVLQRRGRAPADQAPLQLGRARHDGQENRPMALEVSNACPPRSMRCNATLARSQAVAVPRQSMASRKSLSSLSATTCWISPPTTACASTDPHGRVVPVGSVLERSRQPVTPLDARPG